MNYMSASMLGIEEWERAALIQTIGILETISSVEKTASRRYKASYDFTDRRFNMSSAIADYDCGTALCIGGWVRLLRDGPVPPEVIEEPLAADIEAYVFGSRSPSLRTLYFPAFYDETSWDDVTPEDGIRAIENFLITGFPNWKEAIRAD